jgi:dTMP kinase
MKNSKVKLVCFAGIDGSGKTTLAKYLVETMAQNGIKCKYVYGRLEPFILKPFIALGGKIFLREVDMFEDYEQYSNVKNRAIKQHSFLFTVYRRILLFDYLLQILFRVRIPFMLGKTIVCDRYVYDTIITDLSVDMNYSKSEITDLIKRLFCIAPRPDLAFLIDLPEEIAFQRKDDTPSIEYLRERRHIYLDVGKEEGMLVLDGSIDLTEIENLITDEVLEHINKEENL